MLGKLCPARNAFDSLGQSSSQPRILLCFYQLLISLWGKCSFFLWLLRQRESFLSGKQPGQEAPPSMASMPVPLQGLEL